MYRNVVTEMYPDRNGQTETARPNRPDRKVLFRLEVTGSLILNNNHSKASFSMQIVSPYFRDICAVGVMHE